MTQYIDKSVLVAEIKRLLAFYSKEIEDSKEDPWAMDIAKRDILQEILSFIGTIEMKEVDLENSVKGRIDYPLIGADFPNIYPNYRELKDYCDRNNIKDEDKVKIIIIKDVTL